MYNLGGQGSWCSVDDGSRSAIMGGMRFGVGRLNTETIGVGVLGRWFRGGVAPNTDALGESTVDERCVAFTDDSR